MYRPICLHWPGYFASFFKRLNPSIDDKGFGAFYLQLSDVEGLTCSSSIEVPPDIGLSFNTTPSACQTC